MYSVSCQTANISVVKVFACAADPFQVSVKYLPISHLGSILITCINRSCLFLRFDSLMAIASFDGHHIV